MEIWESPLWPAFQEVGKHLSPGELAGRCPGGEAEALQLIEAFEREGFSIERDPSGGCLVRRRPDKLYPPWIRENAPTRVIGRNLLYAGSMVSTQDVASEQAAAGAPDGTVVMCEYQEKGRGRRGRSWLSAPSENILMSVVIQGAGEAPDAYVWTQMASVAVAEVVEEISGRKAWIKWPNDIYLDGRKLCGILAEWHGLPDAAPFVVVGIGLNVRGRPPGEPRAICLGDVVSPVPRRAELAGKLLTRLDDMYDSVRKAGPESIREPWIRRSLLLDRQVRIEEAGRIVRGRVMGFFQDGRLQLLREDGRMETFAAGDASVISRSD